MSDVAFNRTGKSAAQKARVYHIQTWYLFSILTALCVLFCCGPASAKKPVEIRLAVEFVDHAACAHIAKHKNWYSQAGLLVKAFNNYATGMALSAALSRSDIDAAYICLLPAINAYANAGVPLKIVSGTHRYGYGLVVDPDRVHGVRDLCAPGVRLGCPSEGSPPAALLHKLVERFGLDKDVISRARRMPPPKLLLALQSGRIDAAFMPEQYPSMGTAAGFKELVSAADLWPGMQGSVLVVTRTFLADHPRAVAKLVALTIRGIIFINDHPVEAAVIVSFKLGDSLRQLPISAEVVQASLSQKLENTWLIDRDGVQAAIDYAARIGYIKTAFAAETLLDLRYLNE
jgi:NitT/TauT family transport system substrate-binding protein